MTDWIAAGLWVHGAIAPVALAAVFTPQLGHAPAEKARKLARMLFEQMASELQQRMESALNNYETSDDLLKRQVILVIDPNDSDTAVPTRSTQILGLGAEAIRNELDSFLSNHSELMTDWRQLRGIGNSLTVICDQIRTWCMVCLFGSIFGLFVSGIGNFSPPASVLLDLARISVVMIMPVVSGTLVYVALMVRSRNQLSPLEVRYDDLLT